MSCSPGNNNELSPICSSSTSFVCPGPIGTNEAVTSPTTHTNISIRQQQDESMGAFVMASGSYQQSNHHQTSYLQTAGGIIRDNRQEEEATMMRSDSSTIKSINHGDILRAIMRSSPSSYNNDYHLVSSFKNNRSTRRCTSSSTSRLGGIRENLLNSSSTIRSPYYDHENAITMMTMMRRNQQLQAEENNILHLEHQRILMNQLQIEQTQLLLKLRGGQESQQLYHHHHHAIQQQQQQQRQQQQQQGHHLLHQQHQI